MKDFGPAARDDDGNDDGDGDDGAVAGHYFAAVVAVVAAVETSAPVFDADCFAHSIQTDYYDWIHRRLDSSEESLAQSYFHYY